MSWLLLWPLASLAVAVPACAFLAFGERQDRRAR